MLFFPLALLPKSCEISKTFLKFNLSYWTNLKLSLFCCVHFRLCHTFISFQRKHKHVLDYRRGSLFSSCNNRILAQAGDAKSTPRLRKTTYKTLCFLSYFFIYSVEHLPSFTYSKNYFGRNLFCHKTHCKKM